MTMSARNYHPVQVCDHSNILTNLCFQTHRYAWYNYIHIEVYIEVKLTITTSTSTPPWSNASRCVTTATPLQSWAMAVVQWSPIGQARYWSSHRKQNVIGFFMVFSRFLSCGFRWKHFVQKFWHHLPITTDFPCFQTSSWWTQKTAIASFQQSYCVSITLVPKTQLTCHWSH